MEAKTFKFKTSINCGGCIAKVTPFLNALKGIDNWEVDTVDKNKVLTVISETATEAEIVKTVQEAGFKIESIN